MIFLVWAPDSERAKGISDRLDADLYMMSFKFRRKIYSPIKYPFLFLKSLSFLKDQKADTVICQAPPIFCPMAAMAYKLFFNRKANVLIDLHSAALEKPWSHLKPLNTAVMKRAAAVMVSNHEARDYVLEENNVEAIVLEDRVPDLDGAYKTAERKDDATLKIAVPSSFAYDEPVAEILYAAAALRDAKFYLTGDSSRLGRELLEKKTDNVIFTGFLKKEEYVGLLRDSDAVMALTTRDRTLLSGGYDAIALQKPLITSNWGPLRRYFDKGTIHVDNSASEIVTAVQTVRQRKGELERQMALLKEEKTRKWEESFARLRVAVA